MPNLSDAYSSRGFQELPRWRAYLSVFCLVFGTLGVLFGFFGASTGLWMDVFNWSHYQSWEAAGITGGIGGYLVLASIPYATPRVDSIALTLVEVGAFVSCLAAVVFFIQYPENWNIFQWSTIALVSALYLIGLGIGVSAALKAVIGFKVRQEPGGEVKMVVESDGEEVETRVDESTLRDEAHYAVKDAVGGVGLLGGRPDEYVETQTNRPDSPHSDEEK